MKQFLHRILQEIMKKKILGTSDARSMSHSSHWPSHPAYCIEDCRIINLATPPMIGILYYKFDIVLNSSSFEIVQYVQMPRLYFPLNFQENLVTIYTFRRPCCDSCSHDLITIKNFRQIAESYKICNISLENRILFEWVLIFKWLVDKIQMIDAKKVLKVRDQKNM